MKHTLAALGAATMAASATADFSGWTVQHITLGSGHVIWNIYANFSNSGDRVMDIHDTHIEANFAFHQSLANPNWRAGLTQNKNTSDDSWVNIGLSPTGSGMAGGMGGMTLGDSDFVNFDDEDVSTDWSYIQNSGGGAGWYNANPTNAYGYANVPGDTGHVLLAHFVEASPSINHTIYWSGTLAIVLAGQTETTMITSATHLNALPGPSAFGLGAIAALFSGGRRGRARKE